MEAGAIKVKEEANKEAAENKEAAALLNRNAHSPSIIVPSCKMIRNGGKIGARSGAAFVSSSNVSNLKRGSGASSSRGPSRIEGPSSECSNNRSNCSNTTNGEAERMHEADRSLEMICIGHKVSQVRLWIVGLGQIIMGMSEVPRFTFEMPRERL